MKVLILTLGTRGDVQPFVALAAELTRQGHQAVLAAPHRFTDFLSRHHVTSSPIDDGPLALLNDQLTVDRVASGGIGSKVALMRQMPALFEPVLRDCWTAATIGPGAGADVIVHNGQVVAGQHVAEALDVPAVLALPLPMYVPTSQFRWPGQEFPPWLPRGLNRLTFAGMKAPTAMFGSTVDRWRESELGLTRRPPPPRSDEAAGRLPGSGAARLQPTGTPPPARLAGYRHHHRLLELGNTRPASRPLHIFRSRSTRHRTAPRGGRIH